MSDLTKIAEDSVRGGFFLVSGAFIATVISAISAILVARVLGPVLYGQYALSLVISQLLFLFASFGVSQGAIRFSSSLRATGKVDNALQIVKFAMWIRCLTGLGFFILNFALADVFAATLLGRPDLGFLVRLASLSILFQAICTSANSAFIGFDIVQYHALTTIIERIVKASTSIMLVLAGLSVVGAVLGHVSGWLAGSIFASIILFNFLRKEKKETSIEMSFTDSFFTLIRYGLPLYGSLIVGGFTPTIINLILAAFVSDANIGNLKASTNFLTLITVVSVPITTALFPAFSKLNSKTNQKIVTFFKLANKYTVLLIVPIATALIIFSNQIVQIIYGSTYETAALFLSMYCFVYFLVGFGYINLSSLFNGLGETKTTLKISLISLIATVAIAPILTNAYDVPGLIVASICASTVSTIYGMRVAKAKFGIKFDVASLAKIYAIGLASAFPPLLLLRLSPLSNLMNVIIGGILFILVYLTLIPLTKTISRVELDTAYEIIKRVKLLFPFIYPLIKYQGILLNYRKEET